MGDHERIILGQSSLQGHSRRVAIEDLMGLVRPWKEEATLRSIFKAIKAAAVVQVRQSLLDRPCETGDAQLLDAVATEELPAHIWANHFCCDWPHVCMLVDRIFLMLLERCHFLAKRSLPWLDPRGRPLDHWNRLGVFLLLAPLEPA